MSRSLIQRGSLASLVALVLMAAPASAQTTTYTWTGGDIDDGWFSSGNWSAVGAAGPPPLSSLTNTFVVMSGTTRLTNTLDYSFSANSLTFNSGAGAFVVGTPAPPDGPQTLTLGTGGITIVSGNTANQTINANLALGAAGTWANNGSGVFTVGGAVNTGGFQLTVSGAGNSTYSGAISGSGGLTKTGAGTLTLGSANTYTAGTAITGGTVRFAIPAAGTPFGTGAGSGITLTPSGGDVALLATTASTTVLIPNTITVNSGSGSVVIGNDYAGATNGDIRFSGNMVLNGPVTFRAARTSSAPSSRAVFGGIISGTGDITIASQNPALTASVGGPKVVFNRAGSGTANSFGNVTIGQNVGFQLGIGTGIGNVMIPDTSNITFNSGSLFILSPGAAATNETVGALISNAPGNGTITTITPTTGAPVFTLTIGGGNDGGTFSGIVGEQGANPGGAATLALVKTGTGTQIFSGNNTYSSGTTINGGTLLVNGQTASNSGTGTGAVVVNSGGTFGGTGRAAGAVAVNTGGTIRGGDGAGVGTLTLGGGLTLATSANLGVRLTNASAPSSAPGGSTLGTIPNPTSNNFLNITAGGLAANFATLQIVVDGTGTAFDPGQSYSYQIGAVAGQDLSAITITNQAQFTPIGFADPFHFSLSGDGGGAVFLTMTPVPEPAAIVGLAAGVLVLGQLARRRNRMEVLIR